MKTTKHKIKIPFYHATLIIIKTKDIKGVAKRYNQVFKMNAEDYNFDAIVFDLPDKRGATNYYYVGKPRISYGSIAHEAKHIVNLIFKQRGIELDLYNDEPECYLLGWVVNQIHKYIT